MTNEAIDWSRYMEGLQGKVNVDANNLSKVGKNNIAGMGMPSDRYIDLSLGASGSTLVMPADGYIILTKRASASNQYLVLSNKINGVVDEQLQTVCWSSASSQLLRVWLPVRKSSVITTYYDAAAETKKFRFYYAEGSI